MHPDIIIREGRDQGFECDRDELEALPPRCSDQPEPGESFNQTVVLGAGDRQLGPDE